MHKVANLHLHIELANFPFYCIKIRLETPEFAIWLRTDRHTIGFLEWMREMTMMIMFVIIKYKYLISKVQGV